MSGPDPKPEKRHKADFDEWTLIRYLKLGRCRVCNQHIYGMNLHHLVPRSGGGDDKPDNIVSLCGSGTMGCHGAVERRDPKACALLRVSLTAKELAYVIKNKGQDWLDSRYPRPRSAEDVQATASEEKSA